MRKYRLFVALSIVVLFLAAAGMASRPSASAQGQATPDATGAGHVLVVTKLADTDDGGFSVAFWGRPQQ